MTAPTVQTVEAEAITDMEAIIRGYCWDEGSDGPCYVILGCGEDDFYSNGSDWSWGYWRLIEAGDVPRYFIWGATGLSPDTLHYCGILSKDNLGGECFGGYKTFRTLAAAPVGIPGSYWVHGPYWCFLDQWGQKRKIRGEG